MNPSDENMLDPEEELAAEIQLEKETLEQENEWKDKYHRMAADFDNLRKRSGRQLSVARDEAIRDFVKTLLPAKDAMERGLEMVHAAEKYDPNAFKTGMETTLDLLNGSFDSADIETINPHGQLFDPALHEAVSVREVRMEEPGLVLDVFEKGYRIKDQLIRPAKVVVSASDYVNV
jgi:molecular chaperone GrpE